MLQFQDDTLLKVSFEHLVPSWTVEEAVELAGDGHLLEGVGGF